MTMSDDEREYDIETSLGRRAHHNALERKRRDHIKDSFKELRDALPGIAGKKSSRVQILKTAAGYIQHMRRKNSVTKKEIEDLLRQTTILEDAIRSLENGRALQNSQKGMMAELLQYVQTEDNMTFGTGSESDCSDQENSDGSLKRELK